MASPRRLGPFLGAQDSLGMGRMCWGLFDMEGGLLGQLRGGSTPDGLGGDRAQGCW